MFRVEEQNGALEMNVFMGQRKASVVLVCIVSVKTPLVKWKGGGICAGQTTIASNELQKSMEDNILRVVCSWWIFHRAGGEDIYSLFDFVPNLAMPKNIGDHNEVSICLIWCQKFWQAHTDTKNQQQSKQPSFTKIKICLTKSCHYQYFNKVRLVMIQTRSS